MVAGVFFGKGACVVRVKTAPNGFTSEKVVSPPFRRFDEGGARPARLTAEVTTSFDARRKPPLFPAEKHDNHSAPKGASFLTLAQDGYAGHRPQ